MARYSVKNWITSALYKCQVFICLHTATPRDTAYIETVLEYPFGRQGCHDLSNTSLDQVQSVTEGHRYVMVQSVTPGMAQWVKGA